MFEFGHAARFGEVPSALAMAAISPQVEHQLRNESTWELFFSVGFSFFHMFIV